MIYCSHTESKYKKFFNQRKPNMAIDGKTGAIVGLVDYHLYNYRYHASMTFASDCITNLFMNNNYDANIETNWEETLHEVLYT